MGAPKGNQFWKQRSKHGRDKIFNTPEELWVAACEYFEWVEANPLKKDIVYQGAVTGSESLLRAMTIDGLTLFLGVNAQYLGDFEKRLDLDTDIGKDFSMVINKIRQIIKEQKFTGAAAGLLDRNIIARDLGLADNLNHDHTTKGEPINRSLNDFYE